MTRTGKYSLFIKIIAVVLLLCMAFEPGLNAFAEGFAEYVSSLKLFIAEDKEEALAECAADGYIPFDMDLNDGSDGVVVMGYTKTTDVTEAITDISVLEMNSGYTMLKYKEIAEKQMEKLDVITNDLVYSVYEFQDNLELGSPAARQALQVLNLYSIPEMDYIGLGDYLAGDSFSENFLKKLITRSSSAVTYALYTALASGASDFDTDDEGNEINWVTRTINSESRMNLEAETGYQDMDFEYKEYAAKLADVITDFYTEYSAAKDYVDCNGYDAFGLADGPDIEDTSYELDGETMDLITGEEQSEEESSRYLIYITAYEMLNAYEWGEDQRFGDYIVSLGENSYNTADSLRTLYPLAEGLTRGQYAIASVAGLVQLALTINNNEEIEAQNSDYVESIQNDIGELTGEASLSVWSGVDLSIYEEEVALTSAAQRQLDASGSYDVLTQTDTFEERLDESMTKIGFATSVVGIMWFITAVAAAAPAFLSSGFAAGVKAFVTQNLFRVCVDAATKIGCGIITNILGFLGAAVVVVQYLVLAAMLIILLVKLIKWIISLFQTERDKEELEYSAEDIPGKVYDYEDGDYIRYDVVQDNSGNGGDLNAFTGIRFAALYTTADTNAGDPITVSELCDTFILQHNNQSAPRDYLPVSAIGGAAAINLNFYAQEEDADQIYLFYNTEDAAERAALNDEEDSLGEEAPYTEEKEQNPIGIAETDLYLADLELSTASTATAAKNKLVKKGFTVIDYNLTPDAEESCSYLGYKTTKNPDNAIRDIRVSPKTDGSNISFGNATYVMAGETSGGKTQGGLGIYYAIASSCGSPVYANLLVTDNKSDAPLGWEPVNMFCGGAAYNINDCSDEDELVLYYEYWNHPVYIFFEPEEKFTDGTQYLGGLIAVNAEDPDYSEQSIHDVAEYYGFTVLSEGNLSAGMDLRRETAPVVSNVMEQAVYLAYSVTYNKYRALYDIKSYTAAPGTVNLNLSVGSVSDGAYAAIDTIFRIYYRGKDVGYSPDCENYVLGMSSNHSYLNMGTFAGGDSDLFIYSLLEQAPDDFMDASWSLSEEPLLKGLYVQGAVSGKEPLTPDDIVLTSDYSEEKNSEMLLGGFSSVQDFRTPDRTEAHNIAYDPQQPQVLYVRRNRSSLGKYISSVSVVSWNAETALGDDYSSYSDDQLEQIDLMADNICIVNLASSVNGEILPLNLAVEKGETWQADWENKPSEVAYIGVSRTDNINEAITSIIKFMPDDPASAKNKISVDGVSYTKAGDEPVHAASGDYYVYYAKNGGSPGEPITSISFDNMPIIKNSATALTASDTDVATIVKVRGRSKTQYTYARLQGNAYEVNYIHSEYETSKTYIDCLYAGSGDTENEALADLLSLGCNMIVPIDLNQNAGGSYVYLGYSRFNSETGFLNEDYAVRDIICTIGQPAEESIELNGVTYQRAWDRYNWNDLDGAVSLNEGTSGRRIYIYYTSESFPGVTSPIVTIGAHTRDFVPDNQGENIWESVLASDESRCNLNDGTFGTGEDGHSIDNRIYLFVNRKDNSVKPGAKITAGNTKSHLRYGQLSFTE